MAKSFSDQVGAFVAKSEARSRAVFRQSIQDVIEDAQQRVNVDTGFLRSTGDTALNSLPIGETDPSENGGAFVWDADAALSVIAQAKLGDTVFFGWSARYAPFVERRFGFMRLAAQNWQQIVRANAQRLEKGANR